MTRSAAIGALMAGFGGLAWLVAAGASTMDLAIYTLTNVGWAAAWGMTQWSLSFHGTETGSDVGPEPEAIERGSSAPVESPAAA